MLTIQTDSHSTTNAADMDTDALLRNLGRFNSDVLPIGLLRELQSRGDTIHDSLLAIIAKRIDLLPVKIGNNGHLAIFAFALLTPIAKKSAQPLIESLLTLPARSLDEILADLVPEAMPFLIARFFREQEASDVLGWIDRLADHPNISELHSSALYRGIIWAVLLGHLDRTLAIETLANRLKKRAHRIGDLQSAQIVSELNELSAQKDSAVDDLVRASFNRGQIQTDYMDLFYWDDDDDGDRETAGREEGWLDAAEELRTWNYAFYSDDLDPIDATYLVNEQSTRFFLKPPRPTPYIFEQLRASNDERFPRSAFKIINSAFPFAYHSLIDLIREELNRYQSESESWTGNGAYLALVLVVAHEMPLPIDVLQTILRMPEVEREKVFGDQFGLIVHATSLTPLPQHDFIEQWIWDPDRGAADRREMVGFYTCACYYDLLPRETAIEALVGGLQRALLDEPLLIAPYAENLAFLTPIGHTQHLEEAFARHDVEWFFPFKDLRRMMQDGTFARDEFRKATRSYRIAQEMIAEGTMFARDALASPEPNPPRPPVIAPTTNGFPPPTMDALPKVSGSSNRTIRVDARTPRNAPCPCGSGKKYKKCCHNKR